MKRGLILGLFVFLIVLSFSLASAAVPFGVSDIDHIKNETAPEDPALSVPAIAGNVSEINLEGFTTTQSWQGYFGNVTGTIQLADASDNVMYNWSLTSPQGEVYASTNNSITWQYIQCFNFTADGTKADDTAQAGETSLHGTNLTQLEDEFNIKYDDVDGVNETFSFFGSSEGHDLFYTASREFSQGQCRSTRIFNNNASQENGQFEEVLLYEPTTSSVVFTSILDEDLLGFDNRTHDFQMLVLEDGHRTDTETTPYYFWVELE